MKPLLSNDVSARTPFGGGAPSLAILVAVALAGCHRGPKPPDPQSQQQVAVEAERKAASIEAEMNKDTNSESVAKKSEDGPDRQPETPPPLPQ